MKRERMGRIDAAIQRALAIAISRNLKDPRVAFTTVTRVEITPDLERAKVYVSIIGDRHQAHQTMQALERASGFLRGELGHAVALRHTPELVFIEDRSTEQAIAVNKTLARLKSEGVTESAAEPAVELHDDEDDEEGENSEIERAVHDAEEEGLPLKHAPAAAPKDIESAP